MIDRQLKLALTLLFLLALSAAGRAIAQDGLVGFTTPSGNIACQFFVTDGNNVLRCDIMKVDVEPRRPADCDLDWGHAFEMEARGPVTRPCYGDTMRDPSLPVLAYGDIWQRGGFTCRSEQSGLTCSNAMPHGFSLSRGKQTIF